MGGRDGWSLESFKVRLINQGPMIILVKTKTGAICGGYTSKGPVSRKSGAYDYDNEAFVFNMN